MALHGLLFILIVSWVFAHPPVKVLCAIVVDQRGCGNARKNVENFFRESSNDIWNSFAEEASKCPLLKRREAVGDGVPHVNAKVTKDLPHDG